jgi:hypothetical protein
MLLTIGPYAVPVDVDETIENCGETALGNSGPWLKVASLTGSVHDRETLLHEVVHVIDHLIGTGLKERQVQGLSHYLLTVLRDNPALVEYLQD